MEQRIELYYDDIGENQAVKIDIGNIEILITKVDGKLYAVGDRCGHMNASLYEGEIENGIVTCPMHKARFDLRTGKNIQEPKIPKLLSPTKTGKLMNQVKTHDLPVYPIRTENGEIFIEI